MIGKTVQLWICSQCSNYFGSSSTEGIDLREHWNHDLKNRPTFPRSKCPNCKTVDRKLYQAIVVKEVLDTEPNMTESEYFAYMELKRRKN